MARYIDADLLKEMWRKVNPTLSIPSKDVVFERLIDSAPTVDIVRCKDCVYNPDFKRRKGYVWCRRFSCDVLSEGYCSYGTKKSVLKPTEN